MKSKTWVVLFLLLTIISLSVCAMFIYYVDPFFHYHKPHTDKFFYNLYNERSQNDGIIKHFDYEGLITGTSMCENFKTSEAESLFGVSFIKVTFSGASLKETNDCIESALRSKNNLKIVIRGLDIGKFLEEKDAMRYDLGEYPTYLYDDDIFNDVEYLFNKDVMLRSLNMLYKGIIKNETGITSFDNYMNWMKKHQFGVSAKLLYPNGVNITNSVPEQPSLTENERRMVYENVEENIIKTAKNNPGVTFYYFMTPYSAAWWKRQLDQGKYKKQIQAEKIAIEKMVDVDNIKLISINNRYDLTTDLNNYKDDYHYGEWINSLLLRYMHDGKYQLTRDNYEVYSTNEETFYKSLDFYKEFNSQEDYEDDNHAAELLYDEIYN